MNPLPFILLAISLPLLLGGCGSEKKEPVAETIVDPIVNLLSKEELARAYDYNKLEEREGLKYLKVKQNNTARDFLIFISARAFHIM